MLYSLAVQKFKIRFIDPGEVFRGVPVVVDIVYHDKDDFAAGLAAHIVKDAGAGDGVLALGDMGDEFHPARILLHIAGVGDFDFLHGGADMLRVHAEHAQQGDDGDFIVDIKNAVVDEMILLLPAAGADGQPGRVIRDGADCVIGRGGGKAAGALHAADVVIALERELDRRAAGRTGAQVLYNAAALLGLVRKRVDPEIDAPVPRLDPAADQVVGVEDQGGVIRNRIVQYARDELGVRIALDRVAEQVGDEQEVRPDIFVNQQGAALVHFKDREIKPAPVPRRYAGNKARCDAAVGVGTVAVVEQGIAIVPQNISQHIADCRLPVGAGDGDDGAGFPDISQKLRAELQRDAAGQVGRVAAEQAHRQPRRLGGPERGKESDFSHGSFSRRFLNGTQ